MTPTQLAKLNYEAEATQLTEVRRAHRLPWKDLPDAVKQTRIATAKIVLKELENEQTSLPLRPKGNQK